MLELQRIIKRTEKKDCKFFQADRKHVILKISTFSEQVKKKKTNL